MLVRCEKHGRVFDDAQERRCPLCMQGVPGRSEPAPPKLSRATLVNIIVLPVLLVAGAAVWFFYLREPPPPPRPAPVVIDTAALLDEGEFFVEPLDRRPIRQARGYAAVIERVYADRAALLRFSAGPVDTAAQERTARTRARQYARFQAAWQQRLAAAKPDSQALYRPGVQYAPQVESARNFLGAARSALRQAAPPSEVIPLAERQRYLQLARGYLNTARTTLSELP
jgi:hypothetical protein